MKAANLANGNSTDERRASDFYPTPPLVTQALMEFLEIKTCKIWEPACGDGAMSRILEEFGHEVISTDLREDSGYGQGGHDFLTTKPIKCDAIITNPPFNLSEQFIRRALSYAPIVAMVLKSQYWHAQGRTKLFEEYPPAYVLALNWRPDFMNGSRGGSPTMECLWTVWMKGETDTRYRILPRPAALVGQQVLF